MLNANLILGIKNPILDFFNYIIFLNLAIFNQKILILVLLTRLLLSTLLIALLLLIAINFLAIRSLTIVFSIKINSIAIWSKL